MTASPYDVRWSAADCWQLAGTDFLTGSGALRVSGGAGSRVETFSCHLPTWRGIEREISAWNGGGPRGRPGQGICGRSDVDAVGSLDDRSNGVFVSWSRPWTRGLGRAAADCEPSYSASCVTSSKTGCGCGCGSCVA